jgi:hypothetical protein
MKVIIAGSRTITHYNDNFKKELKNRPFLITEVVSGTAKGVDTLGEMFAYEIEVPVKQFKPDWNTHGKKAGHLRNAEMAKYADALIAVWDGESKGTKNMIETMFKERKPVYVIFETSIS